MNQPSLSVVIPYYRGADSIGEAVKSVLGQTLAPDEIVICDDGSPDDLVAALGPLAEAVKIVRKPNGGISSAMNATTDAAEGDFLVQLDQDDVFFPGRLEAIAAAIAARPDADIVATDAVVEYGDEEVARIGELQDLEPSDPRAAILCGCFILWPAIRRERLVEVGGYDESFKVMQDWECFIRLVLGGAKVAVVEEPLYRWRLTSGSRSVSDGVENAAALVRMMSKTLENPALSPAERRIAAKTLASQRRRVALERAHLAVETRSPAARRLSATLVAAGGFSTSTRIKAAVAVASPRFAAAFIEHRARRDPGVEALARRGFGRIR